MSKVEITKTIETLGDIYEKWDNLVSPEERPLYERVVREMLEEDIANEAEYNKFANRMRRTYRGTTKMSKSQICHVFKDMYNSGRLPCTDAKFRRIASVLVRKKGKSHSGVLVITVLTSPYPKVGKRTQRFSCKWNCYYCPNEPGQPRSYLHDEPAVLRANRNKFDPIFQFHDRAATLAMLGHPVDKIEILVLGGTWSSYPHAYQETFVRDLFYAANTFWDRDRPHRGPLSLAQEQLINETAKSKIIGLTLETRPDCINADEVRRLRRYGCTRVQIGIQHTDDDVLRFVNRGHGNRASMDAVRMLMDCCFKVDGHFMPDLPGSSIAKDRAMLKYVLESDDLRVDQMKIYPHAVVPWTVTKKWLDEGRFRPMPDADLVELLLEFKAKVHPWIRLNRVIRDIPGHYISGGNAITNLRQHLLKTLAERGQRCECIRCREVRLDKSRIESAELVVRRYGASGGTEYFISFETPDRHTIFGFLRLRISDSAGFVDREMPEGMSYVHLDGRTRAGNRRTRPDDDRELVFPELRGAALVRELHVYGKLLYSGKGARGSSSSSSRRAKSSESQHHGFGTRMMRRAEDIARLHGRTRMAVIAGVGTRRYYSRLGYSKSHSGGEFMVKDLPRPSFPAATRAAWLPLARLWFLLFALDPDRTTRPRYNYNGWTASVLAVVAIAVAIVTLALGMASDSALW